jgi:hypothetical protein
MAKRGLLWKEILYLNKSVKRIYARWIVAEFYDENGNGPSAILSLYSSWTPTPSIDEEELAPSADPASNVRFTNEKTWQFETVIESSASFTAT